MISISSLAITINSEAMSMSISCASVMNAMYWSQIMAMGISVMLTLFFWISVSRRSSGPSN